MPDKISISMDDSAVTKELHRLLLAPDMKSVVAFNAVFAEVAVDVVARIHVETGSLKTTPRWESPTYPEGWQGEVHVGGAAPGGVHNPAYYGVFELARGGSHFFFQDAYDNVPEKMIDIILAFYSGGDAKLITSGVKPDVPGDAKGSIKSAAANAKNKAKTEEHKATQKPRKATKKEVNDLFNQFLQSVEDSKRAKMKSSTKSATKKLK